MRSARKHPRSMFPATLPKIPRTSDEGGLPTPPRKSPMRIATWNVNSIKQRLEHLLTFLKDVQPDITCLQELKCTEEAFPRMEIEAAGYNVAVVGQKAYNGVAIVSNRPIEDVRRGLPG